MDFDWRRSLFLGDEVDLSQGEPGLKVVQKKEAPKEPDLLLCTHEGTVEEDRLPGFGGRKRKICRRCGREVG